MERARRPVEAARELTVFALVAAAALPLSRLFEEGPIGTTIVSALVLSFAIAMGARRLNAGPLTSWLVSLLGLALFVSYRFFADTLWGPFPSLETGRAFAAAMRDAAAQIEQEVAPVFATNPLLIVVSGAVWFTVVVSYTASTWLRNALLTIGGTLPLFATAGTLLPSERLGFDVAVFAGACVLLLAHEQAVRRQALAPDGLSTRAGWSPAATARFGAVAIAITIVAGTSLPGVSAPPGLAGRNSTRVIFNPIVAVKPALDVTEERELLEVRSLYPVYMRLTSLDRFDGKVWTLDTDPDLEPFPEPQSVGGGPYTYVNQSVTIRALAGSWLPAAYAPVRVAGVDAAYEAGTRTLYAQGPLESGLTYAVVSAVPAVTAADLDGPVGYPASVSRYTELPRGERDVLQPIAREIAGDATTPYLQALRLQNHLRGFTYDERVAASHSFDNIMAFLTSVKRGYCEQFAASMAVLARSLGIPARVAIGFGLGEEVAPGHWVLTTRHAHAWVEVFFPEVGWIIFEPTPRAGIAAVPAYAPAPLGRAPDAPGPAPGQTDRPAPGRTREPVDVPSGAAQPETPADSPRSSVTRRAALAGAGLLALGAIVLATAMLRRRIVVAGAGGAAAIHYVDFLTWCAVVGYGRRPGETPVEHARRIGRVLPSAAEPMGAVAQAAQQVLWGPGAGGEPELIEADERARAALTATLDRRRRLRGSVWWGLQRAGR
ncbi:MAG TPA: DUF3488 and transglutaminase-like domain-containing protein [Actinomycetota bacterium]